MKKDAVRIRDRLTVTGPADPSQCIKEISGPSTIEEVMRSFGVDSDKAKQILKRYR